MGFYQLKGGVKCVNEELKIKVEDMHMGRLIGILSHQMARNRNNPSIVMK